MVSAVSAALPTVAQGVTIVTAKGNVEIANTPYKIATFDVAIIDNLDALGIKPAGILNNLYVKYLDHVAKSDAVKLGTFFEPDFEATHALGADIIIVSGRSSKYFDQFSKITQTVDLTSEWNDFYKSSTAAFKQLAILVGKTSKADEILAKLEASAEILRKLAKTKGTALIVMTNGPKISVYGPGSRFGWLHDDLGFKPAVKDVKAATHGKAISHEFVLKANPDWLFIIDRSAAIGKPASAKATLDNELIAKTTAWQKGQVIYLNSASW